MSYSFTRFDGACACTGDVFWTSWGADCRGNDAGSSIRCEKCHREYTREEGQALWDREQARKKRKRAKT